METEVIVAGIGVVTVIVSSWATWFFTRKKYNSEVDNNIIENMKQSLEFYKQLSDDNKERLNEVLKRNQQLEDELKELRSQIFEIMANICYSYQCEYRIKKAPDRRRSNKTLNTCKSEPEK